MKKEWKLGTLADNERFIREEAPVISPEEGLTILEELRATAYDDPVIDGEPIAFLGLAEYVKTRKRKAKPKPTPKRRRRKP